MVAAGGPNTVAAASPTGCTIVATGPGRGLDPVDGFERWLAFSGALFDRAEA